MAAQRLVVVGASLAGLRAVEAARKSGFDGAITLIGGEEHLPYDRPPLSKAFLDDAAQPVPTYRDRSALEGGLGVDVLLGSPARALDTQSRVVEAGDRSVPYDALVIATGAAARRLPGTDDLAGVHTLRTVDDAIAVRAALDAGARTVVIGAGLIGSEVASGARKRGLPATVLEALPTPLVRAIGQVMGPACASLHTTHGTDLRCGVTATAIEGNGKVERVTLSDGTTLDADLVVVGIGTVPCTDWLAESGVQIADGIVADDTLATTAPGVYAAGDVVRWRNPAFDTSMRLEHWTSAAEQGALAARNALDPSAAKPYSTVPYFWSDWYGTRIQFVGVAGDADVTVVDGDIESHRFVALYHRGDRLVGALTLDRPTEIMKYRGLIACRVSWSDALAFAGTRKAARDNRGAAPV